MLFTLLTQQGGILKPFAWIMGIILDWIYEFVSLFGIHNIAICIIVFTIVTRMIMLPLTIKQQKFTKLSSKMNPELTAINAKYKGKKDEASQRKMQAETQEVYEKYGTTPMGGCLPLLITLPIMFALYRVIYKVPAYVEDIYVLYEAVVNVIDNLVSSIGAESMVMAIFDNFVNGFKVSSATNLIDELGTYTFGSTEYIKSLIDVLTQFNSSNWESFKTGTLLLTGEGEAWTALLNATSQTSGTWISYLKETLGDGYITTLAGITDISQLSNLLGISNLSETVALADVGKCIYWNTFVLATDLQSVFAGLKPTDTLIMNNLVKILPEIENMATDSTMSGVITEILRNNKFIGNMSILDSSGYKFPGVLIPVIAAGTQFLQSKLMKTTNETAPKANQEESPVSQSMKSMTTIMPIMSGVICIMLPIGVGIYWIAGTVVQILQQIFINRYLDKVDMDEMIAKSVAKADKRKAKMGITTNNGEGKVSSVARTATKSVEVRKDDQTPAYKKPREVSDYSRPEGATGAGSISEIANLMKTRSAEKTTKKTSNAENKGEEENQ